MQKPEENLKERVHTMAMKMDNTTILGVAEIVSDWQRESGTEDHIWALFRRDSTGGCQLVKKMSMLQFTGYHLSPIILIILL